MPTGGNPQQGGLPSGAVFAMRRSGGPDLDFRHWNHWNHWEPLGVARQIACLPEVEKNAVDWFLTEDGAWEPATSRT